MSFFQTRYRISRDSVFPRFWAVQKRVWFWPFWIEHGNGLLRSKEEAAELIASIKDVRT